jgi:hypothetical protein
MGAPSVDLAKATQLAAELTTTKWCGSCETAREARWHERAACRGYRDARGQKTAAA